MTIARAVRKVALHTSVISYSRSPLKCGREHHPRRVKGPNSFPTVGFEAFREECVHQRVGEEDVAVGLAAALIHHEPIHFKRGGVGMRQKRGIALVPNA